MLAIGGAAAYFAVSRNDSPVVSASSTTQTNTAASQAPGEPGTATLTDQTDATSPTISVTSLAPASAAPASTTPASTAAAATTSPNNVSTTTDSPTTTAGTPTTTADPTAVEVPATVPALLDGVLTADELPANYSVFANGTMYNFGTVASAEDANSVTSKFEVVVPVEDNFVVTPGGPTPTGIVYVPSGVLFAPGSAKVGAEFQQTLDLATAFMNFFPQVKMTIIGHTDSSGDDATNMALSIQRAETAVRYMVSKGVDPARIIAEGRGESDPVASNDTPVGQTANRRIEFVLNGLLDA